MILHTDRILPTSRPFKLLPLTGGGEICHRESHLGETTTLGCEQNTSAPKGITQLRMMPSAPDQEGLEG
jgi:hypothetical protein